MIAAIKRAATAAAILGVGSVVAGGLLVASAATWLAAQAHRVFGNGYPTPVDAEPARELKIVRAARREHRKNLRRASTDQLVVALRRRLVSDQRLMVDEKERLAAHLAHHDQAKISDRELRSALENGVRHRREMVRDSELRYAIACSLAGAVPGGRS